MHEMMDAILSGRMRDGVPPPKYTELTAQRLCECKIDETSNQQTMRVRTPLKLSLEGIDVCHGHSLMFNVVHNIFIKVAVAAECCAEGPVDVDSQPSSRRDQSGQCSNDYDFMS
jgi:hypothetical protein